MPGIDDRLRRDLERLAKRAEAPGSLARVARRKGRRRTARRVQTAALAAVVLAATAGGGYALTRAFRRDAPVASAPTVRNGKIAFVRGQPRISRGIAPNDIFVMDPDGANLMMLTDDRSDERSVDWSPDGTKLAYVRDRDIYVMNADGSGQTALTSNREGREDSQPDWSPDGTRIAFVRSEVSYCEGMGCPRVHIMNADGSEVRALTSGPWHDHDPTWSPDGSTIAFVRSEPIALGPPRRLRDDAIYTVIPNGSGLRKLTSVEGRTAGTTQGLEWSPDGKRFLFSSERLYTMNPDGTGVEALPVGGQTPRPVTTDATWSPDGTKIAFAIDSGASLDIYVMNADGTRLTQLTNGPLEDFAPAWQPVPLEAPTVEPTTPEPTETSPSPSLTSPGPPPSQEEFELSFGPLCGFTGVFGDFDGDGRQDDAAVAYPRSGETCPDDPPENAWKVFVIWANGAAGAWPLDDCDRACRAVAVADLDGNGTDEFFLVVDQGAATVFFHIYELALGPQPKHPLEVTPPGADGYPADEPITLPYGGSVTHQDFVTCDEGDGVHILIATSAELDQSQGEWNVHETIFSLEAGAFTVVSTRDYQVAYDPSGEEPLPVPGDACFALD